MNVYLIYRTNNNKVLDVVDFMLRSEKKRDKKWRRSLSFLEFWNQIQS